MLGITGQRPRNKNSTVVQPVFPVVALADLQDPKSQINQVSQSGKHEGAVVVGYDGGVALYMATGDLPDASWEKVGTGGGAGGGITNLRIDSNQRALAFVDENGRQQEIQFCDLKATPCEYYIDVVNMSPAVTTNMKITQDVETVVPIGGVSLSGRNHYITLDRANNRLIIPDGGLRGVFRCGIAFRFSPSVKSDMAMTVSWHYRELGTDGA